MADNRRRSLELLEASNLKDVRDNRTPIPPCSFKLIDCTFLDDFLLGFQIHISRSWREMTQLFASAGGFVGDKFFYVSQHLNLP